MVEVVRVQSLMVVLGFQDVVFVIAVYNRVDV